MKTIYNDYKNMIKDLANRFSKKNWYDFEDLVGEGNVVLASCLEEFDEKKASFSTFLYNCLRNKFIDMVKGKTIFYKPLLEEHINTLTHKPQKCPFLLNRKMEAIFSLLITKSPTSVGEVRSILREKGTSYLQIEKTIKELRRINQGVKYNDSYCYD